MKICRACGEQIFFKTLIGWVDNNKFIGQVCDPSSNVRYHHVPFTDAELIAELQVLELELR